VKSKRRGRSTSCRSRRADALARHATGPTTAEGKAISSQNARKHGLNAAPPEDLVTLWFNVILNNRGDAQEEPNAEDPRREVALKLAIAEARYHRSLYKIETHYQEPNSAQSIVNDLYDHTMNLIDGDIHQRILHNDPFGSVKLSMQVLELMITLAAREQRLHMRYLGEARAQRKKALMAWCAFNQDEILNSRNELSGAGGVDR